MIIFPFWFGSAHPAASLRRPRGDKDEIEGLQAKMT
jgi:hypothetical protein